MTENTTELVPTNFSAVLPVVSAEQAKAAMKQFNDLKASLLTDDDFCNINGKIHITRKGCRKYAFAFGLSDEIIEEHRLDREDGSFVWEIKVKVTAPNRQSVVGIGLCDSKERKFSHIEHDVKATAHTRAKNRAIMDLVGVGLDNLVSAEEMSPTLDAEYKVTDTPTQTVKPSEQSPKPVSQVWFQDKYRLNVELCTTETDPLYQTAMQALSQLEIEGNGEDTVIIDGYAFKKSVFKGNPCLQRTRMETA